MKVFFVGSGPGDPELLTVRAERLLKNCRCCIYAGSLVSPAVVSILPANAELHDSAGMTLDQTLAVCTEAQKTNVDVIRLHTGDPSIYGAIREQMTGLDKLGIDYEVIPGISSFQAAAAVLRTELTAPEGSQTIVLTRTAGRTPMPQEQSLTHIAPIHATLCIFLSTDKLPEIAASLSNEYGKDCPAAVVYHASWPDQKVVHGSLGNIAAKADAAGMAKKTAMILVGRALGRDDKVSKLYDAGFSHGYRKGNDA